jgi:DNA-binding transcriptional regulator YdaS (Cro superfamily)
MNLTSYLAHQGRGATSRLAADLQAPVSLVSEWANGTRPVPAERCPEIERLTQGAVRCEDLRPDVNWAVLRGTAGAVGHD